MQFTKQTVMSTILYANTSGTKLATLFSFCRYKHEIRKEDKEGLRKLTKRQYHYQVTPEITRELDASR